MDGDTAIRVSRKMPSGYRAMEVSQCDHCREAFKVIHHVHSADAVRARKQAEHVKEQLTQEHADGKHVQHRDAYGPLR